MSMWGSDSNQAFNGVSGVYVLIMNRTMKLLGNFWWWLFAVNYQQWLQRVSTWHKPVVLVLFRGILSHIYLPLRLDSVLYLKWFNFPQEINPCGKWGSRFLWVFWYIRKGPLGSFDLGLTLINRVQWDIPEWYLISVLIISLHTSTVQVWTSQSCKVYIVQCQSKWCWRLYTVTLEMCC